MGDRLATIYRHGPKSRGCCAPFRGGAGSPSNAMSPGSRPTSVPSCILIHRPQATKHQRYRQTGQRSRGTGRTGTCNGRPKRAESLLSGRSCPIRRTGGRNKFPRMFIQATEQKQSYCGGHGSRIRVVAFACRGKRRQIAQSCIAFRRQYRQARPAT